MNSLFVRLATAPSRELEQLMRTSPAPDLEAIAGHEWAGYNTPITTQFLGIRRFIKVFTRDASGISGHNLRVSGHRLDEPWSLRGDRASATIGCYRVIPGGQHGARYPLSALIDYGAFRDQQWVVRSIRDHLVQPVAAEPDVLLGKAFFTLGGMSVPAGYFVLERLRPLAAG